MKILKNALLVALVATSGVIFSQEKKSVSNEPSGYFPTTGNMMIELNFKPFSSTDIISFDNLKAKYRITDNTSLRLGLKIENKSNKQSKDDYLATDKYPTTTDEHSLLLGVIPGIEYHFLKNKKVSPYIGCELSYLNKSSNATYEEYTQQYTNSSSQYTYQKQTVDGAWLGTGTSTYTYNGSTYNSTYTTYDQRSFSSLGGNVLFGSDFYFIKNLYFGFEIGLGFNNIKYNQITIDVTNQVEKTTIPSYHSSDLSLYYNNSIRLGVWF